MADEVKVDSREVMSDRICVTCVHFNIDMGSPGYSEMTPGTDASIGCLMGKWRMSNYGDTAEYRKHIAKAATCEDYADVEAKA